MSEQSVRKFIDPFDTMRANRVLAPNNPKLNDVRWLVGESLRRTHFRAENSTMGEAIINSRAKLRAAEDRVGPHAWPIVTRIVIEGAGVRDCRGFVPELATPWRADAVVTDRLRVALDMLGPMLGVTCHAARPADSAHGGKRREVNDATYDRRRQGMSIMTDAINEFADSIRADATRAERERVADWVEQWGGENSPACIAAAIRARSAPQADADVCRMYQELRRTIIDAPQPPASPSQEGGITHEELCIHGRPTHQDCYACALDHDTVDEKDQ